MLICPSVLYLAILYLYFPETKAKMLEEIGLLFGDGEHVASHWYDANEEKVIESTAKALK